MGFREAVRAFCLLPSPVSRRLYAKRIACTPRSFSARPSLPALRPEAAQLAAGWLFRTKKARSIPRHLQTRIAYPISKVSCFPPSFSINEQNPQPDPAEIHYFRADGLPNWEFNFMTYFVFSFSSFTQMSCCHRSPETSQSRHHQFLPFLNDIDGSERNFAKPLLQFQPAIKFEFVLRYLLLTKPSTKQIGSKTIQLD